MHTRLLITIAVSGAVHAGAFVIGTGLYETRSSGLNTLEPTTTITVSVVFPMDSAGPRAGNKEVKVRKQESPVEPKHRESRKRLSAHDGGAVVRPQGRQQSELPVSEDPGTNSPAIVAKDRPATHTERHAPERPRRVSPPEIQISNSDKQVASAPPPDLDANRIKEFEKAYLMEFLAELSRHKFYPRSARMSRLEGKVVVSLVIRKDGSIENVELDEPSRVPVLNRAAVQAVERLGNFKPFPPGMERATWHLSVPFRYLITDR